MCQHSAGTALARLSLYRAVPRLLMQHGGTNRHGTICHRAIVVPCLIVPCLIVLVLVSCWAARLAIYRSTTANHVGGASWFEEGRLGEEDSGRTARGGGALARRRGER